MQGQTVILALLPKPCHVVQGFGQAGAAGAQHQRHAWGAVRHGAPTREAFARGQSGRFGGGAADDQTMHTLRSQMGGQSVEAVVIDSLLVCVVKRGDERHPNAAEAGWGGGGWHGHSLGVIDRKVTAEK